MKRFVLLPWVLLVTTWLVANDPVIEQAAQATRADRHSVLISHGINPSTADLLAFLESGFSEAALRRGLPQEPVVKAEVVNKSIEELGLSQAREAVPVLMRIAAGDLPEGVQSVLRRDVEVLPVREADMLAALYAQGLRRNAVVALGLNGDPKAADTILQAMREFTDPAMVSEGAVALGLLGDPRGLLPLLAATRDPQDPSLPQVFAAVYFLTGRNYNITEVTPIARRREAVEQYRQWHQADGQEFEPRRAEILRRRHRGLERPQLPVETLRGALRATRDMENYDRRFAGREHLRNLGPGTAPVLREVAMDPLEDLDIRRAAMTYYSAADPRAAGKDMRILARKDENPMIREQAESLIGDIERALKAPRSTTP